MNHSTFCPNPLRWRALTLAAVTTLCSLSQPALAADASTGELSRQIEALRAELAQLKLRVDTPVADGASSGSSARNTVFSGYGEIVYTRPTRRSADTQFDLQRFVLGLQHRFDAQTHLVTELEVEHAVASAEDAGEVAMEQAYVERQLGAGWSARAGLFLVPLGLLNESHEPPVFLGVQRNRVETAIIPTTWREGGVQVLGQLGEGLSLQAGLASGFNLGAWDAASEEGSESPLGAIHQELAQAKARDLSVFAALNWRGLPGLQLGAGVFTGGASQGQTSAARVTLWEAHARWTPGAWDLQALTAHGQISGTAAINTTMVGNPTLIPERFDGSLVQAGYTAWRSGEMSLTPFARLEWINTGRAYAELGAGLTPAARATERSQTLGLNWQLNPGVVLKADMQRTAGQPDSRRLNLGLGWSF